MVFTLRTPESGAVRRTPSGVRGSAGTFTSGSSLSIVSVGVTCGPDASGSADAIPFTNNGNSVVGGIGGRTTAGGSAIARSTAS